MDEHRAPWEPRGFYLFRRLFRASVGFFVASFVALTVFFRFAHFCNPDKLRDTAFVVLVVGVGVGVLGIVAASVGMIVTAPKDRKRGGTRTEDEPTERRRRL